MRIFVAGATGTIGRRLVPLLAAQGHEVTALTRHSSVAVPGSSAVVVGDVYDAARLREVVAEARAEVVIHQLTDLGARDFAANNRIRREGTRNLVDAALAAGVRRVISQSIAWAYEPGDTPADEDTPLDLRAADDTRRATVEAVHALETITAEAPEWVVLRYGLFYGPGTWYTAGALMADLAAAGKLPTGPDITSFVHVDDAATATAAALTWPTGPVNIVDNTPAPASTWAPAFTHSLGLTPNTPPSTTPPYAGAPADSTPRTPWARGASNARARALGWSPAHPTCFSG